jgi:hypothetical protein
MANEFKHKDPGTALTQAEFIASDGTGHIFDSQAAGDVLYASSTTVLARLAKATDGNVLELASGLPAWTASPTIGSTSWANANHAHAASNSGGTLTTLGTVTTGVWQGTAIASGYIAADAITGAKIADDAVDSEHYTDGSIDTAHLAADAVTGAKIADDAIDSEHYTDGSIDNAHLADDAVDSDEIAAGAIDTAHIADNQVTVAKIEDIARGSVIVGNASAATAELTIGSNTYVLTSDGTDIAWAAASAGAVTREGGQTSEATTTSGTAADLLTAASLTIAAAEPAIIIYNGRKTSGAGADGGNGLKINSTVIAEATESESGRGYVNNGTDEAQSGCCVIWLSPRVTNYLSGALGMVTRQQASTPLTQSEMVLDGLCATAAMPTGTITSVIIRVNGGAGGPTWAADELQVYSLAVS